MVSWRTRLTHRHVERRGRAWTALGMLLVGCIAPLITYRLDGILRYRVNAWVHPPYLVDAIGLLEVQARDQPWSLITLVGVPLAAGVIVVIVWMRRPAILAAVDVYACAIAAWERRIGTRIGITLFPNSDFGRAAVIGTIVALVWCVYWLRSRRVLETFGSRGLDLFVERSTPPELAATPTSEMSRK